MKGVQVGSILYGPYDSVQLSAGCLECFIADRLDTLLHFNVIGEEYVILEDPEFPLPPAPAESLEDAVKRINEEFEAEMAVIDKQYPQSEQKGWARQEDEARAFLSDPMSPTPLLDSMIGESGEDKTDIAQSILAKVEAYSAYYGAALGRKRYKIAQLEQ